jgi:diguanylate cyclase (GGDEF)-like protein
MDATIKFQDNLSRFSRSTWMTLGMLVVFAAAFAVYVWSEERVDRAYELRLQSFLLANEMRQSSDDLSRLVRTYVVTGASIYKRHYQEILDIRDGKRPRPLDYQNVYWDLVLEDDQRPRLLGPAVPLLELMRQAGFTEVEFAQLAEAKANSDALTRSEFAAMQLIELTVPPTEANRAKAVGMLFDTAYRQAKAGIMRPIGQFHQIADQRTLEAVDAAKDHATRARLALILFGVLLVALLLLTRRNLHAILGGSVNELHTSIARLGSGNFSFAIPVAKGMENSVVSWVSETQINLARIDAQRKQAEEEVSKRTKELSESVRQHQLAAQRAEYFTCYDGLTALPNRSMFSKLLNQAINLARRHRKQVAVLFADLDRFKNINDTLGHDAGDLLLQEVAKRLQGCLRESDTVARLGGDEFVILLPAVRDASDVELVARKILAVTSEPFVALGQEVHVTASVGVSIYPKDGDDEQSLMKKADIAMYQAKEGGKNHFQFYSVEMNRDSFARLDMESSLRRALHRGEFQLHYQPKIDARSGAIVGIEALLRWQHPELGVVAPGQFIPIAEETGLIVSIGKWVIKTACTQNVAWQKMGLPHLHMAVNLSRRQFADESLPRDVTSILRETRMSAHLLELEITESTLMHDVDKALYTLKAFRDMGVRLAIDNFGTGYFSLSNLNRFPVDTIKIDGSLVRDLSSDVENGSIAEATIAMARKLSMSVLAEGVETKAQADFLRELACDEFQGFYFSQAVTADKFAELLEAQTPMVAQEA